MVLIKPSGTVNTDPVVGRVWLVQGFLVQPTLDPAIAARLVLLGGVHAMGARGTALVTRKGGCHGHVLAGNTRAHRQAFLLLPVRLVGLAQLARFALGISGWRACLLAKAAGSTQRAAQAHMVVLIKPRRAIRVTFTLVQSARGSVTRETLRGVARRTVVTRPASAPVSKGACRTGQYAVFTVRKVCRGTLGAFACTFLTCTTRLVARLTHGS